MILVLLLQAAAPAAGACPNPDTLPAHVAAQRCEGVSLANAGKWRDAAAALESAARAIKGGKAASVWAQAGNAWLAAGEPVRAGTALDAALAAGAGTSGFDRGEAMLDRARAAVAAGDLDGARTVLDGALVAVPDDPLAWLLSATLARRMGQPARAATDIAQALKRSPDDAAVQLEAGNIAARAGDAVRAKAAWSEAARLQPQGDAGRAAKVALAQFATP